MRFSWNHGRFLRIAFLSLLDAVQRDTYIAVQHNWRIPWIPKHTKK